ncbi:hypothetical protein [Nocardia sp. NPDC059691]|uniref:hypothetical protein n=1 Tax=Nocardia sp. NPDC059691 TaxID=3346908 RepID=UPI0036CC2660
MNTGRTRRGIPSRSEKMDSDPDLPPLFGNNETVTMGDIDAIVWLTWQTATSVAKPSSGW